MARRRRTIRRRSITRGSWPAARWVLVFMDGPYERRRPPSIRTGTGQRWVPARDPVSRRAVRMLPMLTARRATVGIVTAVLAVVGRGSGDRASARSSRQGDASRHDRPRRPSPGSRRCLAPTAAALCLFVLGRVDVAWHADGFTMCAALVTLSGAVVVGWEAGPDLVRSVGGIVAPMLGAALLVPVARRAFTRWRWPTLGAGVVLGVLSLGVFAVRDPSRDPWCRDDCSLAGRRPWHRSRRPVRWFGCSLRRAGSSPPWSRRWRSSWACEHWRGGRRPPSGLTSPWCVVLQLLRSVPAASFMLATRTDRRHHRGPFRSG